MSKVCIFTVVTYGNGGITGKITVNKIRGLNIWRDDIANAIEGFLLC